MRLRDQILTTAGTNVACAALALVTSIVLARGLGPELRGVFFLLQSYLGISAVIVGLSLPTIMTVLVSRNEFSLSQVHSAALGLSLALGLAGGAATLAVVRAFVPLVGVSRVVAVLFIFTMPMVVYKAMWGGLFLGLTRIASLNAFNLLDSVLVTLASVLALLVFRAGLDGVLLALVVQASLMVVLGLAFV